MDIINMESFYDITSGDFKDIWDSDLDPSDTLKLSSDSDMHDWFLERDVKIPPVILHDKLMSDAFVGTLPIKTEHSYSLNSDGDSMPDSPGSLQNKMDDMDEECFPAISMSKATSRRLIDPNATTQKIQTTHNLHNLITTGTTATTTTLNTCQIINSNSNNNNNGLITTTTNTSSPLQPTLNPINMHLTNIHAFIENHHHSSTKLTKKSNIIEITRDIDIDNSCIKDEPMSAEDEIDSSCPASPNSNNTYGINLANVAAITNTDLVFEHKGGALHLSQASQSLLKSQPHLVGLVNSQTITATSPQKIIIPKVKVESHQHHHHNNQQQQIQHGFGLPPTPPSSLPSDESEGNQSPEHHLLSPMSPPTQHQINSSANSSSSSSPASSPINSPSTRRSNQIGINQTAGSSVAAAGPSGRGYTGSSTRQPIHTPLISSQPKGSTGTLILTEEEKRTLLAEGYPIPTRLPLTKAEEKSLKKIRRKIKNKISAQESRRKKKEYMDQLERRVEILVSENSDYRKRVESLEDSNANLLNQLSKLQALVNRQQQNQKK